MFSCNSDPKQDIPIETAEYVNDFFYEANRNGLPIKLEDYDITIEFRDLEEYAGLTYSRKDLILIDNRFWRMRDSLFKEWLIFHELGHLILNREHLDAKFKNNECVSYMYSGNKSYDCSLLSRLPNWREYYMKELFRSHDEDPTWYNPENQKYSFSDKIKDTILSIDTTVMYAKMTPVELAQVKNFVVELSVNANSTNLILGCVKIGRINYSNSDKITLNKKNHGIFSLTLSELADETLITLRKEENLLHIFVNQVFIQTISSNFLESHEIELLSDNHIPHQLTVLELK